MCYLLGMNMIKKFLLLLGLLLISASSVMALSSPRWSYFPLNVYIQQGSGDSAASQTVKSAFQAWQGQSSGILKFFFKNTKTFEKTSQISVYFVDTLPQNAYYKIDKMVSNANYLTYNVAGFYLHMDLKIRTKENDGKKIAKDKLYAIAMQAVGQAMGIGCLTSKDKVMSCSTDFTTTKLTSDDIMALKRVYRLIGPNAR